MLFLIFVIIIIAVIGFVSYIYYKTLVDNIFSKLIIMDSVFENRYTELTRDISQFLKYMPEYKDLITDIQSAKADVAKLSRPKTSSELSQKILNENALTINVKSLINKCDFDNINPDLKDCIIKQAEFINKIGQASKEYNKLITDYKNIKEIFPFNLYSKIMHIDLDLDFIKTE